MKRKSRWFLLFLLTVLLSFGVMAGEASAISGVGISKTSATIIRKQKLKLEITGTKKKVTWSSSNKVVAKVSNKGVVTGVKAGKATIRAKVGRVIYFCKVKVKSAGLDKKKVSLKEKGTAVIKLYGTKIRSVSTSKKSVASISKSGKITAKKAGKAKLTLYGKNGKKYTCTVTVKPGIKGVTLNQTSLELLSGKTAKLTASVKPAKASNKKVTFTSSNPAVAAVNASGTVTAVGPGKAKITAVSASDSSKKAVCNVTVISTVITTQSELDKMDDLVEMGADEITIQSDTSTEFVVPRVDCPNVDLVVDVPNANVTNKGNCGQIVVKSVNNSFVEQAMGNDIVYQDTKGKITIGSEARDTNVYIAGENANVEIENNGSMEGLWLQKLAQLKVRGASTQRISTIAQPGSAGSTITTCKNLQLDAEAKVTLILEEGAEHTLATVTDNANIPAVRGLGSVEVTNKVTHEVETVVAENDNSVANLRNVTLEGGVTSYEGKALEETSVYLIKYSNAIDADGILNYVGGAKNCATNASGRYSFEDVSLGNYYLAAVMKDMKTVVQTVIINSDTGSSYNNEMLVMLPEKMTGTGSVSGTVVDAGTGHPVDYPVTLKIRKGKTNRTGEALQTVSAASGGQYRFENIPAGSYTVQVISSAAGETSITTNYINVVVLEGEDTASNITVTPTLNKDEMRFVLRWGTKASGAPSDLDSHLVGPTENGEKFHIWYSRKTYSYNGQKYDELDVDDTEWEGPETSTIRQMVNGVYDFYVYDYSNQDNEASTEMSQKSNAYVQVYDGDVLLATYHIPQGGSGNLWHVCSFDSTTRKLTEINSVGYWPSGSGGSIGGNMIDTVKGALNEKISSLQTLYDEKLTDGKYKTEVQDILTQARTLYESSQDYDAVSAMAGKLSEYISEIRSMPEQEIVGAIDRAQTIQPGQTVSFETSGSTPVCYTFTPESDGYYTFRITPGTESSGARCTLYNRYKYETSESYDYTEKATILSAYLITGRKYTFAVSGNYSGSASYTAVLAKGRYVMKDEFSDALDSVKLYYENRYIADSSLKSEVEAALNKADELYGNYSGQDMETVLPLYEKLLEYEEILEDLPSQSLVDRLNTAKALQINVPVTATVTESESACYSFTAGKDGQYVLTMVSATEDAEQYCTVYTSDYRRWDDVRYGGTLRIEIKEGQKYFFVISEDLLDTSSCTLTIKEAESEESDSSMIDLELDLDISGDGSAETEELMPEETETDIPDEPDSEAVEMEDIIIDETAVTEDAPAAEEQDVLVTEEQNLPETEEQNVPATEEQENPAEIDVGEEFLAPTENSAEAVVVME